VSPFGFFPKEKTATGHPVVQWQCLYGYCVVFVYYAVFACVDAVKEQRVFDVLAVEIELWLHHFFEHGIGIYMQWCRASQQPECGYETYKPKAVVAMQMGYEYVVYE
jgi:hypothetical protein